MQYLIDIESKGQSLLREQKLLTYGGEKEVSFFIDLSGLDDFGGGPSEAIEVVSQIEVEWSCVFGGLDGLVFVVVETAFQALEITSESMLAVIDFSHLGHFSIKIIKANLN